MVDSQSRILESFTLNSDCNPATDDEEEGE